MPQAHVQCPETLLSWAEKRIKEQWTLTKHEEQQDFVCDTVIVGQQSLSTERGVGPGEEGGGMETDRTQKPAFLSKPGQPYCLLLHQGGPLRLQDAGNNCARIGLIRDELPGAQLPGAQLPGAPLLRPSLIPWLSPARQRGWTNSTAVEARAFPCTKAVPGYSSQHRKLQRVWDHISITSSDLQGAPTWNIQRTIVGRQMSISETQCRQGVVAHTCDPSSWEEE